MPNKLYLMHTFINCVVKHILACFLPKNGLSPKIEKEKEEQEEEEWCEREKFLRRAGEFPSLYVPSSHLL